MTIIKNKKVTPSVNIVRDMDKALDYIPTPNTQLVFKQITSDFIMGVSCFNIIGAYGTGKSSFLWAFNKALNREKDYFSINEYYNYFNGFASVNIVGQFTSIIEVFASEFGVEEDYTTTDIIRAIDKLYKKQIAQDKGLVIFIDEFGKFLEFAAKNNPEHELYFIQQLAEYINDTEKYIFLITTLHQDFNSYSFDLTKRQRNEWSKVKGRLKEVTFNEPVEQLLFLASERLNVNSNNFQKGKVFKKLFKSIRESRAFPLRDYLNEDMAGKLLPLDILAASILTLALQKYGQNERSLFSFLEGNDHLGINTFQNNAQFYNISKVYDYLAHNFSVLNTKYNPHYPQWIGIKLAIERVEGLITEDVTAALTLVKTIGLLNIYASAAAIIDDEFLESYGKLSLGIKTPKKVVKNLNKYKIIRFVKHTQKYILFEGTDLDIELAIDEAGNLVEEVSNIVNYLNTYFDFPYILAKSAYYEYGTPRFFEFQLSEEPIQQEPKGEIDGFINLIFSEELNTDDIKKASKNSNSAIIFGWYENTLEIRKLIFEIQKIQKVIENHPDDKVAQRELKSILDHQVRLLNHYVLGSIYSANSPIQWFFKGEEVQFNSQKEFNRELSRICQTIYAHTPKFKSELVNKTKLSSPILTAQKNLIRKLVDDWNKEDLGFSENAFPPEKSIYLSLLSETGLLRKENGIMGFSEPTEASFKPLWKASLQFLKGSKSGKRNLQEFINTLLIRPFKLKKGFIDFWLPIFLFAKRDDFALFEKDIYVPYITDQVLEVVSKNPHKYSVKAFDIEGVNLSLFRKYRELLDQKNTKPSNQSFIETIRPFLTFYKSLPAFTKSTSNLPIQALNLREAIAKATNPEKTFFEDFPAALGYDLIQLSMYDRLLDEYVEAIQDCIRQIRTAYDGVMDRFEACITDFLGISKTTNVDHYRTILQGRFKQLKYHRLMQHQKVFLQRVTSDLDRGAWLSAVCQSCIGKTLENISDAEEVLLYDRFIELVKELDNLYELSKAQNESEEDDFVSLDITDLETGQQKQLVRVPKGKKNEVGKQKKKIEGILGQDKEVNIVALTKILKDLLDD